MSAVGSDIGVRPSGVRAMRRIWRAFARGVRRLERGERYSPVLCIATLVIVGLLVKTVPAIHFYVAHN